MALNVADESRLTPRCSAASKAPRNARRERSHAQAKPSMAGAHLLKN
jgi:hypothetical protein